MVNPQEPSGTEFRPVEAQPIFGCGNGLRAITSVSSDRYYKNAQVQLSHRTIAAGLGRLGQEEMPTYLPERWATYVHPEGQLYFLRHTKPAVVTEAYLFNPEILQQLVYWLGIIERCLEQRQITFNEDVELFLQLEDSGCGYYFVDHRARTEFWLDSVDTETLGLPQVASEGHLKLALTEHYWNHVEYYPTHFMALGNNLNVVADELISILAHAKLDRITSNVSTVPFTSDECSRYLKLLKTTRGNVDACSICVAARLWVLISSHRFSTHYGQESSRLSRTQNILALPSYTDNMTTKLIKHSTLGISEVYKNRLEEIFVDDIVYIDQWHKFIKSCMGDWTASVQISTTLLFAHAIHCVMPCVPSLGIVSAFLLFASILSAVLLNIQHRNLRDTTADQAADYLLTIRSKTYGFQIPALVFALPSVLSIFGAAMFVSHGLTLLALHVHLGLAAGLAIFVFLFSLCIKRALSPRASLGYTPPDDTTEKCNSIV